jgi:CRISPR system Cascade subunit CasA
MPLNLISDPWIPVLRRGRVETVRPDQIAEPGVERPCWPRPDLDIACMELLIGLVHLADPPRDEDDWIARRPDPERLRARLAPLARAFELAGEDPRFLQDLEPLDGAPNPPDMLFIDSAGANAARNSTDLMVKRGRYPTLPLPLAAMALYALQAFAPSGGAGNRTSIRGGGPMTTLVMPRAAGGTPLWDAVWANVPPGRPTPPEALERALPWMRPTRTSEKKGSETPPPPGDGTPPEMFFGMPRRLRLVTDAEGSAVTGVIQKNYGTNYAGWLHPLTPYYAQREGAEKLPRHPKPGAFGYPNWLGVLLDARSPLAWRAECVERFLRVRGDEDAAVLVAGWAMDNMKPLDFVWSEQPLFALSEEAAFRAEMTVEAAREAIRALLLALSASLGVEGADATLLARARENFYATTQAGFEATLRRLAEDADDEATARAWLETMKTAALGIFDPLALPGLPDREREAERIVQARRRLVSAFAGWKPWGPRIFNALELPLPTQKTKKTEASA